MMGLLVPAITWGQQGSNSTKQQRKEAQKRLPCDLQQHKQHSREHA
jgi:hypothetical protein